jgi:hypothetical protein
MARRRIVHANVGRIEERKPGERAGGVIGYRHPEGGARFVCQVADGV